MDGITYAMNVVKSLRSVQVKNGRYAGIQSDLNEVAKPLRRVLKEDSIEYTNTLASRVEKLAELAKSNDLIVISTVKSK